MHGNNKRVSAASSGAKRCRSLVVPFLLAAVVGCQEYDWRSDYARAEQEAREQDKYLFVFYKWWLDSDSNHMLNEELSDPAVKTLFQDTINLLLDKDYGPQYVEYVGKYGVTSYPASIIVAPDGSFKVQAGRTPKERFIEWAKQAKPPRPERPGKQPEPPPRAP